MSGPQIKWIKLKEPAVALNSSNVHNKSKLKYNPVIQAGTDSKEMIAKNVPDGVNHLIFNCHGFEISPSYPAHLAIGTTVTEDNVEDCCASLRGIYTLRVIWLSACNIGGSQSAVNLCKKLAKTSLCYVVTQTMSVYDVRYEPHSVLDTSYAMPTYYDLNGKAISPSEFFNWGSTEGLFWRR